MGGDDTNNTASTGRRHIPISDKRRLFKMNFNKLEIVMISGFMDEYAQHFKKKMHDAEADGDEIKASEWRKRMDACRYMSDRATEIILNS